MFHHVSFINERIGKTGVKKREKREIKLFTNKRKRKRVRGDYCIEPYSSLSTGSTRMAILHLCCIRWIVYSFFFSGVEAARVMVAALPLAELAFADTDGTGWCFPQKNPFLDMFCDF